MPAIGNSSSGGKKPTTPTIGTATDGGTGTTISVPFTPSTYIGKGSITYTALSSPGSISATGAGSPITVSGLTTGTSYTFTVKGDTNYGVASDFSSASNSITPITPSSFESIATINGNGSNNIITFSSIPATYKHLQLRLLMKGNGTGTGNANFFMYFNNDFTYPNYSYYNSQATASSISSAASVNDDAIYFSNMVPQDSSAVTNFASAYIIDIMDYNQSKNRSIKAYGGADLNRTSTPANRLMFGSGLWKSTSSISSIQLVISLGNYSTLSSLSLYGIKG